MATVKEMMMQDAAASIETSYDDECWGYVRGHHHQYDRRHGGLGRGRTGSGDDLFKSTFPAVAWLMMTCEGRRSPS